MAQALGPGQVLVDLSMFQWLADNGVILIHTVDLVDAKKGLVLLPPQSVERLRDGTGVLSALKKVMGRAAEGLLKPKAGALAKTSAQQGDRSDMWDGGDEPESEARLRRWQQASELFLGLTGFEIAPQRKELLMCGDEQCAMKLLEQIRKIVSPAQQPQPSLASPAPFESASYPARSRAYEYSSSPTPTSSSSPNKTTFAPRRGKPQPSRLPPLPAVASSYPTGNLNVDGNLLGDTEASINRKVSIRNPAELQRRQDQVISEQQRAWELAEENRRARGLSSGKKPSSYFHGRPENDSVGVSPPKASVPRTLPTVAQQSPPAQYSLGRQPKLLGLPIPSSTGASGAPTANPNSYRTSPTNSYAPPTATANYAVSTSVGTIPTNSYERKQRVSPVRSVGQSSAPIGSRVSPPKVDQGSGTAAATGTDSSPRPKDPQEIQLEKYRLRLGPFVRRVILIQNQIRWLYSARLTHYKKQLLTYTILTQCRYRYLYRMRPTLSLLLDDKDRYPTLKGQCARCIPLIAAFREKIIARPDLSQKRIAAYISLGCTRCRTLMNSMERWRPMQGERQQIARDRALRRCQAMLRAQLSVQEKWKRIMAARTFIWSTSEILWKIIQLTYRLRRREIKIRTQDLRQRMQLKDPKFPDCARCTPIILAMKVRSELDRRTKTLGRYLSIMCRPCQLYCDVHINRKNKNYSLVKLRGCILVLVASLKMLRQRKRKMVKGAQLNKKLESIYLSLRWHQSYASRRKLPAGLTKLLPTVCLTQPDHRCLQLWEEFWNFIYCHRAVRYEDAEKCNFLRLDGFFCEECLSDMAIVRAFLYKAVLWRSLIKLMVPALIVSRLVKDQVERLEMRGLRTPRAVAQARKLNRSEGMDDAVLNWAPTVLRPARILSQLPKLECRQCWWIRHAAMERLFFSSVVDRRTRPSSADAATKAKLQNLSHQLYSLSTSPTLLRPLGVCPRPAQWRLFAEDLHRRVTVLPTDIRRYQAMLCQGKGSSAVGGANDLPLCNCARDFHRSLGRTLAHRWLNWLCRVVVLRILRWRWKVLRMKHLNYPKKSTLAESRAPEIQLTTCPRCKPFFLYFREVIRSILTFRVPENLYLDVSTEGPCPSWKMSLDSDRGTREHLQRVGRQGSQGDTFWFFPSSSVLSGRLLDTFSAHCCAKCIKNVLYRQGRPADLSTLIQTQRKLNFARFVIGLKLAALLRQSWKKRVAARAVAPKGKKTAAAAVQTKPLTFLNFHLGESSGKESSTEGSEVNCPFPKCAALVEMFEARLRGLYFNGWTKTLISPERPDFAPIARPRPHCSSESLALPVRYTAPISGRTVFYPSSYFLLMCGNCAFQCRKKFHRETLKQLEFSQRAALKAKGKLLLKILRRRIRPLIEGACQRCWPLSAWLHQVTRRSWIPTSTKHVEKATKLMCLRCKNEQPTLLMTKLSNQRLMLFVENRLRVRILRRRQELRQLQVECWKMTARQGQQDLGIGTTSVWRSRSKPTLPQEGILASFVGRSMVCHCRRCTTMINFFILHLGRFSRTTLSQMVSCGPGPLRDSSQQHQYRIGDTGVVPPLGIQTESDRCPDSYPLLELIAWARNDRLANREVKAPLFPQRLRIDRRARLLTMNGVDEAKIFGKYLAWCCPITLNEMQSSQQAEAATKLLNHCVRLWETVCFVQDRYRWAYRTYPACVHRLGVSSKPSQKEAPSREGLLSKAKSPPAASLYPSLINTLPFAYCVRCDCLLQQMQRWILRGVMRERRRDYFSTVLPKSSPARKDGSDSLQGTIASTASSKSRLKADQGKGPRFPLNSALEEKVIIGTYRGWLCGPCSLQLGKWVRATLRYRFLTSWVLTRWRFWNYYWRWVKGKGKVFRFPQLPSQTTSAATKLEADAPFCTICGAVHQMLHRQLSAQERAAETERSNDPSKPAFKRYSKKKYVRWMCMECRVREDALGDSN
jgi:hypothetical protein